MEQLEDQFIISYKTYLAKEGKEICKEVDSMLGENDELLVEKAQIYSNFCLRFKKDVIDEKLYERCNKYQNDMRNYRHIKVTLEDVSSFRKMV